jgi:hypothetical protein
MEGNADSNDIKPPVRKIVKDLTQRCVREIVREATKQALRNWNDKDILGLQEAMKRLSDQEKQETLKGIEDEVSKKIYQYKSKDNDLVKEISKIIQRNLVVPKIKGDFKPDVPKPRPLWKGLFFGAVKLCIVIIIATAALGAYLSIFNQETQTTTTVDNNWNLHTGDVQVTLSWYANADIDLHVEDPNGDEVYYGNPSVPSGGQLDLDNKCANFVMGKPENIYWPKGGAPHGTYRVSVTYYGDCSPSGSSAVPVDWTVTTKVNGNVNTYKGTLYNVGDTEEVTTFQF